MIIVHYISCIVFNDGLQPLYLYKVRSTESKLYRPLIKEELKSEVVLGLIIVTAEHLIVIFAGFCFCDEHLLIFVVLPSIFSH